MLQEMILGMVVVQVMAAMIRAMILGMVVVLVMVAVSLPCFGSCCVDSGAIG
jgi:hypothetical protein